ncbi:hypothetical protein Dimus_008825 [Dionaea muscipula]
MTVEEVDTLQTERNALSSGRGRPYLKALKSGTGGDTTLEDTGSPAADEDVGSPTHENPSEALELQGGTGQGTQWQMAKGKQRQRVSVGALQPNP